MPAARSSHRTGSPRHEEVVRSHGNTPKISLKQNLQTAADPEGANTVAYEQPLLRDEDPADTVLQSAKHFDGVGPPSGQAETEEKKLVDQTLQDINGLDLQNNQITLEARASQNQRILEAPESI